MRFLTATACVGLLVFALPAQKGDKATDATAHKSAAKAEYDKLVDEFDNQMAAYSAEARKVVATDAYKQAAAAKDRDAVKKLFDAMQAKPPDRAALSARFLKAADEFAGDERVPFLAWAATNSGSKKIVVQVIDDLQKNHLKSPELVTLLEKGMGLSGLLGREQAQSFLAQVIDKNPHAIVRAWAMYLSAMMIQRDKSASDEDKDKVEGLLATAAQLAEGTDLAATIAAPRFEKEHLQIGMQAPDIAAEDMDGVQFKLSDYRGKVVVLDFWGFW
jgi:hypothetical protein